MAKQYRWFAISVAALCVMSILPAEQSAAANTLCVNPKGSKGCYSTISAGVAAANSGDTVRVGQGTYREHVIINKPLSLIGFNAANTIIDASGDTGNVVTENGYDCGITLASHRAAPGYGGTSRTPYGVFHNTVANNESSKNGLAVSGNGVGVGLFTSPGPPTLPTLATSVYDNIVIGNRLTGNGQPGVAMHAHKAGARLTGNLITGNYIADNGADASDTPTAGANRRNKQLRPPPPPPSHHVTPPETNQQPAIA